MYGTSAFRVMKLLRRVLGITFMLRYLEKKRVEVSQQVQRDNKPLPTCGQKGSGADHSR